MKNLENTEVGVFSSIKHENLQLFPEKWKFSSKDSARNSSFVDFVGQKRENLGKNRKFNDFWLSLYSGIWQNWQKRRSPYMN